ncbi:MAG: DUF402 domain-containing protein [Ilumatobacteraceae bacterium]|nr:DUF402 domain-containing protein [Ilumatobacteraceae bacterium]
MTEVVEAASASGRWEPGTTIVRREVLGLDPVAGDDGHASAPWVGSVWMEMPVRVVEDSDDALVVHVESGAPFTFPDGPWPADGRHPWSGRSGWHGHGCLMVQRPGDHHAIWHFWTGPERTFACWYVNLQTAFRRTADAIETQDLELDLVVAPDGSWEMKDWDLLDRRVTEGRFTVDVAVAVRRLGVRLGRELDAGRLWWDLDWQHWTPDDAAWAATCVACGSSATQGWDTGSGRVRMCVPCATAHDIGCP